MAVSTTGLCFYLQDLEAWVSGEHGFVVFTLGTMVSDMLEETAVIFLEAFRQIPQKVKEHIQYKYKYKYWS